MFGRLVNKLQKKYGSPSASPKNVKALVGAYQPTRKTFAEYPTPKAAISSPAKRGEQLRKYTETVGYQQRASTGGFYSRSPVSGRRVEGKLLNRHEYTDKPKYVPTSGPKKVK